MQTQPVYQGGSSTLDRGWDTTENSRGESLQERQPRRRSHRDAAEQRARLLGYFSLALGAAELAFAGPLAKLIGLKDTPKSRVTLRLMGVREMISGVGILAYTDKAGSLWSRVAGDAIDLTLLGQSFGKSATNRARLAAATTAVAGVTAVDVLSAARLSRSQSVQKLASPIHVVRSITINRAPETVYAFWRDLENLPRFMAHLESVVVEDGYSSWRAKAPAGMTVEWRAEITLDRPNETIAWRSLEGASVPNRGVVRFKAGPGGRGTEVLVELKYEPPGGMMAAAIAKLFGEEPGQQISGDLRRLKQVLETGSVVHSDASIHSGMHAARPPSEREQTVIKGSEA